MKATGVTTGIGKAFSATSVVALGIVGVLLGGCADPPMDSSSASTTTSPSSNWGSSEARITVWSSCTKCGQTNVSVNGAFIVQFQAGQGQASAPTCGATPNTTTAYTDVEQASRGPFTVAANDLYGHTSSKVVTVTGGTCQLVEIHLQELP